MAQTEVTRVLVKDGRQNCVAESMANHVIPVSSRRAFCVSSGAPAEAAVGTIGLADACNKHRDTEDVRIGGGAELELEFLR